MPLLDAGVELDIIEIDRDLIPDLEALGRQQHRLHVHYGDALEFDFDTRFDGSRLRVVGNLPYNISTPLIFHLLGQRRCIRDMHFMLQKEVVDRMAADPGGREYGRLSVMVQLHCEVHRLFDIGPGAFRPPPRVESTFVRLIPHAVQPVAVSDPELFESVVKLAFMYRRKTLRNALCSLLDAGEIAAAGIDPGLRAERLGLKEFASLADQAGLKRRH